MLEIVHKKYYNEKENNMSHDQQEQHICKQIKIVHSCLTCENFVLLSFVNKLQYDYSVANFRFNQDPCDIARKVKL